MADSDSSDQPIKSVPNRQPNGTFGKGNIANPRGRPKRGWTWADILAKTANRVSPKSKKKYRIAIAEALLMKCLEGDVAAIREFMNRMDGLPQQFTDLTSGGQQIVGFRYEIPHGTDNPDHQTDS